MAGERIDGVVGPIVPSLEWDPPGLMRADLEGPPATEFPRDADVRIDAPVQVAQAGDFPVGLLPEPGVGQGIRELAELSVEERAAVLRPADRQAVLDVVDVLNAISEDFLTGYAPSDYNALFGASAGNPDFPKFDSPEAWLAFLRSEAMREIEPYIRAEDPISISENRQAFRVDAQQAVQAFINGVRDYHVDGSFRDDAAARLNFQLRGVQDGDTRRFFVGFAPESRLGEELAAALDGQEVLSIDGVSMTEAIADLTATGNPRLINNLETDLRFAELFFTVRLATLGEDLPENDFAVLELRDPATGEITTVNVPWTRSGTPRDGDGNPIEDDVPVADDALVFADRGRVAMMVEDSAMGAEGAASPPSMMDPDAYVSALQQRTAEAPSSLGVELNMERRFGAPSLGARLAQRPEFQLFADRANVTPMNSDANPYALGGRTSYLPYLGEVQEEAADDDLFHWYTYTDENGDLAATIRIPSYSPALPPGDQRDVLQVHSERFGDIIERFNQLGVEHLTIDQVQNPGGAVPYLYGLVRHLITEPVPTPHHHVVVSDERFQDNLELLGSIPPARDAARAAILAEEPDLSGDELEDRIAVELLGESFGGYPVDRIVLRDFIAQFEQENRNFQAGRGALTDPVPISGVDFIRPAPEGRRFEGRITVVTDAMDISGGDFFPAIMQDTAYQELDEGQDISERRIVVIGDPNGTSGAGGFVLTRPVDDGPDVIDLASYRITASNAVRNVDPRNLRGRLGIEKFGVYPDIPLVPTVEDITSGHVPFGQHIAAIAANPREFVEAADAAFEAGSE